jgi:hypothetical protein
MLDGLDIVALIVDGKFHVKIQLTVVGTCVEMKQNLCRMNSSSPSTEMKLVDLDDYRGLLVVEDGGLEKL